MIFQIDNEEVSNKKLHDVSVKSLILELPNLLLMLISAIIAHTMIVWLDVLGSVGAVLHSAIIVWITRKIRKITNDAYQYDSGRLEIMASLICDILMLLSYFTLIYNAFYDILSPSFVNQGIVLYLFVKIFDILFDFYFYHSVKKIYQEHSSKVNESVFLNWRNNLLIDLIIGFISVAVYFMKAYSWSRYISPGATIILSVLFIIESGIRIRNSFDQLIDAPISILEQDKIVDILLENYNKNDVDHVDGVKCYIIESKLNIVIGVVYKEKTTYQEQIKLLKVWSNAIRKQYPNSIISVELKG